MFFHCCPPPPGDVAGPVTLGLDKVLRQPEKRQLGILWFLSQQGPFGQLMGCFIISFGGSTIPIVRAGRWTSHVLIALVTTRWPDNGLFGATNIPPEPIDRVCNWFSMVFRTGDKCKCTSWSKNSEHVEHVFSQTW